MVLGSLQSVYTGQLSLWLLTLSLSRMALCPRHSPAHAQVVLDQSVGLRGHWPLL